MSKEQTAEEMTPIQTEQLNQIVSRTDVSGNQKVKMIKDFITEYATLKPQEKDKEIERLKAVLMDDETINDIRCTMTNAEARRIILNKLTKPNKQ